MNAMQTRIAEVVGSNPIVSTRNVLMDTGFSEGPPSLRIAGCAGPYPRRRTGTLFGERISRLSARRPSPRRPDDQHNTGSQGYGEDRHRLIRGNRSTQHYDTVVNGPAEFTGRRQYLPDGETQSSSRGGVSMAWKRAEQFFLILRDQDKKKFNIVGPMTDDSDYA